MEAFDVYKDINARTGGEVYIGVVGPVRCGKSTFIKRFMDLLVLPNIKDEASKKRAIDEMPQSAAGKTIMTTEPKFIPKDAADIAINDDISLKVRLIDCVGFMVDGANGHMENDSERMIKTPWFDYDIPFTKAATIGTQKVITDHSTIGMVITTDGSFGDLKRESYIEPEKRTVDEMKKLGKPFIIILNSATPNSLETIKLAQNMEENYKNTVVPLNCDQLKAADIIDILGKLLLEFPIEEISFSIPKWVEALDIDNIVKANLIDVAKQILDNVNCVKDVYNAFPENEFVNRIKIDNINMDIGQANIVIEVGDKYYYNMLSELIGEPIDNEYQFVSILRTLSQKKNEYEDYAQAIASVKGNGYGIVTPAKNDIVLDRPEIIKHGNKYGVKIKAMAPTIHMIKANVTTEIAPIVGSEEQAKDLISYIDEDTKANPDNIWGVNIFGKNLEQLVDEGMRSKTTRLSSESQTKLQDTMEKIVNDSNGGLVCIII